MALPERSIVYITTADLGALNGPAIHVLNVVNGLARNGWSVTLLAPVPARVYVVPLETSIVVSPLQSPRVVGLPGSIASLLVPKQLWSLRHADVIYIRSAPGSVVATISAIVLGRGRCVVEFNGWISEEAKLLGSRRLVTKVLGWAQMLEARKADVVRVVTAPLGARAVAAGARQDRVHVIPTGTDLKVFRPLDRAECRRALSLDPERPIAAFLGNLWPAVDIDTMVQSIALLRNRGVDIQLLVVGDGVNRGRLEELVAHTPDLATVVRLLGALKPEDANVVLGATDVALAPFVSARNEAIGLSPMKIRDYASAGKATVATAFRGIADLADEPWLFLAEPENVECFASAISMALSADSASIGNAARNCAVQRFGWSTVVNEIEAMIAL
jgi:glycosyltransferase involved in cell wall biosynthesis